MFAPPSSYYPRLLADLEVALPVSHPLPIHHLAAQVRRVALPCTEDKKHDRDPENESEP
jgi:hypothetical protein